MYSQLLSITLVIVSQSISDRGNSEDGISLGQIPAINAADSVSQPPRDPTINNGQRGNSRPTASRARIDNSIGDARSSTTRNNHAHLDSVQPTAESEAAPAILKWALTPPEQGMVPGEPLTLQEAMNRVSGAIERAIVAKAYWQLTDSVMAYHMAASEARFLESLPDSNAAVDAAQLDAARTDAIAGESEAYRAVIDAQFALTNIAHLNTNALPVPADSPLVAAYRTRVTELFPGESAPRDLRRIDRILPMLLESIHQRADAIESALQASKLVRDSYGASQVSVDVLLRVHGNLYKQRRAFLTAVMRYNNHIADYAMQVAGGQASSDQVVAMLIGRSRRAPLRGLEPDAQPVMANAPFSRGGFSSEESQPEGLSQRPTLNR